MAWNAATEKHIQAVEFLSRHHTYFLSRPVHVLAHHFAKACLGGSLRPTLMEWAAVREP